VASNSIGNLSIIISGNASGLTTALSQAQKQLQSFNRQATATSALQSKFQDRQFGRLGRSFSNDAMESKNLQRMWDQLQRGMRDSAATSARWSKLTGSHFDVVGQKQQKMVAEQRVSSAWFAKNLRDAQAVRERDAQAGSAFFAKNMAAMQAASAAAKAVREATAARGMASAWSPITGATSGRAFAQARRDLEARTARLMGTIAKPAPGLFSQAASGTGSFLSAGAGIGKSMLSGLTSFLMTAGPTIGNALGTAISAGSHIALGFAAAGGAAIKHALEKAMDFQDLLVGFEVMTGSAQQGRQMLETLEKFSATLPFTSGTVMKAARTLAGNGVAMNNVLPALQSIATVVAATGGDDERFGNMVLAFSQVTSMGKLMGQELRQLNDAGFTIDNIAKSLGVSAGEVRKLMEEGAVSTQDIYRAFNMATREGGKFDGLLVRMAGTTRGQFRRLESELSIATRKIGEGFREAIDSSGVTGVLFGALSRLDQEIPNIQRKIASWGSEFASVSVKIAGMAGQMVDDFQSIGDAITDHVLKPLVVIAGLSAKVFRSGASEDASVAKRIGKGLAESLIPGVSLLRITTAADRLGVNPVNVPTTAEGWNSLPPEFAAMGRMLDAARIGPGNRAQDWPKRMESMLAQLREAGSRAAQDFGGLNTAVGGVSAAVRELAADINKTLAKGATPMEQFRNRLRDIGMAAAQPNTLAGWLGWSSPLLGQFGADFARRDAFLELEKGMDKFKYELPKAMERGSVDAASTINRALYQTGQESIEARVLRVMEMQKANGDKIKQEVTDIGRAIERWEAANIN